jgi:hypothetical protein
LISYTVENRKKTFQCTHPNRILEEINRKEKVLGELKEQIPEIKKLFDESKKKISAEVYRGSESIKSLLNELLEYKESFWIGGNSFEKYKAVPKSLQIWFSHWMDKRVKKKHIMNDLVSYGTCLNGLEPNNIKKHKEMYYKYYQLPKGMYTPMVIIIFGNKVAQVIWGEQPFAFVLSSEKIKESFMKYFNYFSNIKPQTAF